MKETENRIDQLFESARNEAPVRSFESSKDVLISAIGTPASTGTLAKWANLSFTFKTLIMVGIIGVITTCFLLSNTSNEKLKTPGLLVPKKEKVEVIDHENQVVIQTTYLDANKDLAEITTTTADETNADTAWLGFIAGEKTTKVIEYLGDVEPTIIPSPELEDSTNTEVRTTKSFTIQRNSMDSEAEEIRKLAEAAGLTFHYNVLLWKGKIKRFNLKVRIDKGDGKFCEYSSKYTGKFVSNIHWVEDANGKAIDFWTD